MGFYQCSNTDTYACVCNFVECEFACKSALNTFYVPGAQRPPSLRAAAAQFVVLCRDGAQEQALQGLCMEEGWSLHAVHVGPPNFATVP